MLKVKMNDGKEDIIPAKEFTVRKEGITFFNLETDCPMTLTFDRFSGFTYEMEVTEQNITDAKDFQQSKSEYNQKRRPLINPHANP